MNARVPVLTPSLTSWLPLPLPLAALAPIAAPRPAAPAALAPTEQDPRERDVLALCARIEEIGHKATIFPLRPIPCNCAKGDKCERQGKHPAVLWRPSELPAGEQRITPGATGYGLATGARSGVIVLDFDTENAFWDLARERSWRPVTFTAKSPRGLHVYLQHPGRFIKTSAKEIAPDVDLRADGGFAVAPGSLHESGKLYHVERDCRIEEAPAWLLSHPATRRKGAAQRPGEVIAMPEVIVNEEDLRWRVDAAREWLETKADPCVATVNGNKNIWLVGLELMRTYELPSDLAVSLFQAHFNPRCTTKTGEPYPWEEADIRRTLTRARDHGHRTPGCPSPVALRAFLAACGGGK